MRSLVAAGDSHRGRVRDGNEDALLMKQSVFAVADGMGGHLAGEVASATALDPVEELDGRVFPDATAAVTALRDAVVAANGRVSQLAEDNPEYRGMGTTLTAALVEGRRLHVAHVGDSRAYLLRDGHFSQLTDDHTFVQHLIDEGQITREEAANHPQRSIITRAIGVSPEVDVDSMSLDLQPHDQLLLCSDGLTGVVPDGEIADTLQRESDPDAAVKALIDRANAAGGPDNITVVLLRYEDTDAPSNGPTTIAISSRTDRDDGDWARQLGTYGGDRVGDNYQGGDDGTVSASRILGRSLAIVLGLAVLVGAVWGGGSFLLSRSFYIGLDGDQVVIYEGIDRSIGTLQLSRVIERTELTLEDIPSYYHEFLESGRPAADLNDARRRVAAIPTRDTAADVTGTDEDEGDAEGDAAGGTSNAVGGQGDADGDA
jgi:PPM family protein phosphatase